MKKIIVNSVCASLVCFLLSSFSTNSNPVIGTNPLQDTTHNTHKMNGTNKMGSKKKMNMDKTTDDKTTGENTTGDTSNGRSSNMKMKMKTKKKPA